MKNTAPDVPCNLWKSHTTTIIKAENYSETLNKTYRENITPNAMPQSAFLFFTGNFNLLSQQSQRPDPFILTFFRPGHEIEMHFVKASFNIIPHS